MAETQERSSRKARMRTTRRKRKQKYTFGYFLRKSLSFALSLAVTLVIACAVLYFYLRTQALPAATTVQTTQILDVHGNVIDTYYTGENRNFVPLEHISKHLIQATLAIEDKRFFKHFGIDPRGLARAVVVNAVHMDKVQGASTITQQLARNLYLNHERTWGRKIKEALYSIQLEMNYSKEDILEQYLNQIYFGHSAYGVEAAARMYFNKKAADLTLAESSLLAGVPKGPKYYSPYMDEANAKKRQRLVLNAMVENEFITQEQADRAFAETLVYMPLGGGEPEQGSYFRDYIRNLAIDRLGISEHAFAAGGIRIHTTLDLRAQAIAEQVVSETLEKQDAELQAALIAIDPRNGHIKAMVGGKNYTENQYNRVFAHTRQPGSAFKAFVYLAALESKHFTPVTQINSEPTAFSYDDGKKTYTPRNFGNQYFGMIDMRNAIAKSDNIYAVQTTMQIGPERVVETARKLGVRGAMQPLPSLALGTYPASPFEMAYAFGALANQGVRTEPTSILRIEDAAGNLLYEASPKQERVADPAAAYVLTKLMESVFESGGTGYRVNGVLKRPIAAKTGTTNTDAWMVGYTPELATAVWVGYDKDRTISALESYLAAPIFAQFTEQTLEAVPPKIFPMPEGVVSVYIDPLTGKLATADCPSARLEFFIEGTEPLEYCEQHGHPSHTPDSSTPPDEEQKRTWWEDLKRWWGG